MLNLRIIIIRKGTDKEMEEENQEQEYEIKSFNID